MLVCSVASLAWTSTASAWSNADCKFSGPSNGYYFDGSVTAGWIDATRDVLPQWPARTQLRFTEQGYGLLRAQRQNLGNSNVLGVTNAYYANDSRACDYTVYPGTSRPGNIISHAYVTYNSQHDGDSAGFKQKTAVHEFGHSAGLGHTAVANTVMYGASNLTITPQPDDVYSVNVRY